MREPVCRSARSTRAFAADLVKAAADAALLIGDFRSLFGATVPILHAFNPGMEALTQDNDTWQTLGLAALRVLSKIKQTEDLVAGKQHQAERGGETEHDEAKRAEHAGIVGDRKRSSR